MTKKIIFTKTKSPYVLCQIQNLSDPKKIKEKLGYIACEAQRYCGTFRI